MSETYGVRDSSISAIYRNSGIGNYDMDKILVKWCSDDPAAILEFKHGNIKKIDMNEAQLRRFGKWSSLMHVPFFIVIYYHQGANGKLLDAVHYPHLKETEAIMKIIMHRQYYLIAGNEMAEKIIGKKQIMSEKEFWELQQRLIGSPPIKKDYQEEIKEFRLPEIIHVR